MPVTGSSLSPTAGPQIPGRGAAAPDRACTVQTKSSLPAPLILKNGKVCSEDPVLAGSRAPRCLPILRSLQAEAPGPQRMWVLVLGLHLRLLAQQISAGEGCFLGN